MSNHGGGAESGLYCDQWLVLAAAVILLLSVQCGEDYKELDLGSGLVLVRHRSRHQLVGLMEVYSRIKAISITWHTASSLGPEFVDDQTVFLV